MARRARRISTPSLRRCNREFSHGQPFDPLFDLRLDLYFPHNIKNDIKQLGLAPERFAAGQPLGVMDSTGTVQAAAGVYAQGLHLHWELHINGHYFAQGLSIAETEEVYRALFQFS